MFGDRHLKQSMEFTLHAYLGLGEFLSDDCVLMMIALCNVDDKAEEPESLLYRACDVIRLTGRLFSFARGRGKAYSFLAQATSISLTTRAELVCTE